MRAPRRRIAAVLIAVVVVGIAPLAEADPAAAVVEFSRRGTGTVDLAFTVHGELPAFPCSGGCSTSFAGSGVATVEATSSDGLYTAVFAMPNASVVGGATYTEPGVPFCPSVGSAAGGVYVSGTTTGVVHRATVPPATGTILGAWIGGPFTYQRVGATSALVVNGGMIMISFTFPDTGFGSMESWVLGGGAGAFEVDPAAAATRCLTSGSLPFTMAGDAALTLT